MNISTDTTEVQQELREEIAQLLGVPVEKLPGDVSPAIAGKFLSTAPRTLSIWRSTGRYNLPYYKAGGRVRYRVVSLIKHKASRIFGKAGEVA